MAYTARPDLPIMALQLSDEWKAFEAAIGMRPKFGGKDIAEIRENVVKARAGVPPVPSSTTLDIYDETLGDFQVRVYKHKSHVGEKLPLALFIHGGGFCIGDLDSEEEMVRFMAENAPATFVSVDYSLAPESPWPQSLNDCVAAAHWALKYFKSSDTVDTSKFIVTGGSAGAQLALSTSIQLLDSGVLVHGVVVLAPLAIGQSAVPSHMKDGYKSMTENAEAPLVDTVVLKQFMNANGHDDTDPSFSVLLNKSLNKFPKTYVATCGADCLRDDGFLLVAELRSHKISVEHDNYPGYPHYFWVMPQLEEKKRFLENLIKGLRFVLS